LQQEQEKQWKKKNCHNSGSQPVYGTELDESLAGITTLWNAEACDFYIPETFKVNQGTECDVWLEDDNGVIINNTLDGSESPLGSMTMARYISTSIDSTTPADSTLQQVPGDQLFASDRECLRHLNP
jgi:hypothetical protein